MTRSDVKLNLRVNTASGSIRRAWQGIPVGISSRWIQYLTCQYADHLSMFRFDYNSIAGIQKKKISLHSPGELFVGKFIQSACFRSARYEYWIIVNEITLMIQLRGIPFVFSHRRIFHFGKRFKLDWTRGHSKKTREEINFVADPIHLEIPRSRGTWCRQGSKWSD